jgi:hypothetical protein
MSMLGAVLFAKNLLLGALHPCHCIPSFFTLTLFEGHWSHLVSVLMEILKSMSDNLSLHHVADAHGGCCNGVRPLHLPEHTHLPESRALLEARMPALGHHLCLSSEQDVHARARFIFLEDSLSRQKCANVYMAADQLEHL